jgi:hypothetical protein
MMKQLRPQAPARRPPATGAPAFLGAVWLAAFAGAVYLVVAYGSRHVPSGDDWNGIVHYAAGQRLVDAKWFWSQHNEHRVPLLRLVLLTVLKLTGGDFRVALLLDVLGLALAALAITWIAYRIRGRFTYTDAFLPLIVLSLSQYPNLLSAWQFQFVSSTVLLMVLLCVMLWPEKKQVLSRGSAIVAGICLVLLPLCGANGLVPTPMLALWASYSAVHAWQSRGADGKQAAAILVTCGLLAVALCAVYFVSYKKPPYHPDSAGLLPSARAVLEILPSSFGEVATVTCWPYLSYLLVILALASAAALIQMWYAQPESRPRLWSFGFFAAAMTVFIFGLGWGRSGFGLFAGVSARYSTLVTPALCVLYLVWVLRGGAWGSLVQHVFFLLSMVFLWPIIDSAMTYGQNKKQAATNLVRDIQRGLPVSEVAARNAKGLFGEPRLADQLLQYLVSLRKAGFGPFRQMKDDAAAPLGEKIDLTEQTPRGVTLGHGWRGTEAGCRRADPECMLFFRLGHVEPVHVRFVANVDRQALITVRLNQLRPGRAA